MKKLLFVTLLGLSTVAAAEQTPPQDEEGSQPDTVVVDGRNAKAIYEALNLAPQVITLENAVLEIKTASTLSCMRQTTTEEENDTSTMYSCIMAGTLIPPVPEDTPPKPN